MLTPPPILYFQSSSSTILLTAGPWIVSAGPFLSTAGPWTLFHSKRKDMFLFTEQHRPNYVSTAAPLYFQSSSSTILLTAGPCIVSADPAKPWTLFHSENFFLFTVQHRPKNVSSPTVFPFFHQSSSLIGGPWIFPASPFLSTAWLCTHVPV